jgi:hypothetical protein
LAFHADSSISFDQNSSIITGSQQSLMNFSTFSALTTFLEEFRFEVPMLSVSLFSFLGY